MIRAKRVALALDNHLPHPYTLRRVSRLKLLFPSGGAVVVAARGVEAVPAWGPMANVGRGLRAEARPPCATRPSHNYRGRMSASCARSTTRPRRARGSICGGTLLAASS